MDPILVVRPAAAKEDLAQVLSLLRGASLPTEGVEEHFSDFLVAADSARRVVGAIGMERYADRTGLLRSAVVDPSLRNTGIGSKLYERLLEGARSSGIRRIILLTTTAERYFTRKGFTAIPRLTVSGPVTQSTEFTSACPESAVCMVLMLEPEAHVRTSSTTRG